MKNKKQSVKILSLTLLLSLLCAAAPFSSLAKENTPDTAVDTTQDIIIDDDTLSADHGTWAWDSGSNTLTLKGIDLKADGPAGIQIKVAPYVYLELAPGTQNKISPQSSARNCSGIIKDNGNLIIRGSGSLSITTDDFGIASSYASLFIEGEPTIQITAVQGAGKTFGIYANEKFEMNGGSLAVSDFTTGVLSNEGIAFKGGTTEINNPATAGESITARTAAGALTVASPLEYWGQSGFEYTAGSVEISRLPEVYQDTFIDLKTKKPASSVKIFTPPTPINNAKISITGGPFTFTGAPKEPEIRVMINGKALQEGVDYKIDTYTDNINAGTAKVRIRGISSYTGTTEQSFVIEAAMSRPIIKGEGTLNITSVDGGISVLAASLTIEENPTINLSSALENEDNYGISAENGIIQNGGNITVKNCKQGISSGGGIDFNNGNASIDNSKIADSLAVATQKGGLTVSDKQQYAGLNGEALKIGANPVNEKQDTFIDTTTKAAANTLVISPKPGPTEYTIDVNNDGNGYAWGDLTKVAAGTVVKLNEKAKTGYQFKEWQVEAGGVKIENNQFTMPEGNISIKAVFEKTPTPVPSEYTITVNNDGKGTASADVTKAKAGTVVKLSQKANKGYQFKEWKVEAGTVTIKDNQFTMPEGNVVIKAVFEKTVAPTPTPSPSPSPTTQKTETKTNVSTGIISNETGVYSAVVLLSVAGLMALVIKRKMKG